MIMIMIMIIIAIIIIIIIITIIIIIILHLYATFFSNNSNDYMPTWLEPMNFQCHRIDRSSIVFWKHLNLEYNAEEQEGSRGVL